MKHNLRYLLVANCGIAHFASELNSCFYGSNFTNYPLRVKSHPSSLSFWSGLIGLTRHLILSLSCQAKIQNAQFTVLINGNVARLQILQSGRNRNTLTFVLRLKLQTKGAAYSMNHSGRVDILKGKTVNIKCEKTKQSNYRNGK